MQVQIVLALAMVALSAAFMKAGGVRLGEFL